MEKWRDFGKIMRGKMMEGETMEGEIILREIMDGRESCYNEARLDAEFTQR
jgi:hypothetical protein